MSIHCKSKWQQQEEYIKDLNHNNDSNNTMIGMCKFKSNKAYDEMVVLVWWRTWWYARQ